MERAYYERTRIFPIMHTVAVRRELYERHPWIARSRYKAFEEPLRIAYADLRHRNALKVMQPWPERHVADTLDVMGAHYLDYGLDANRHVLETFARYSHAQGLADRVWAPEGIVLPQAGDAFRV